MLAIARAPLLDRGLSFVGPSPLAGVTNAAWAKFVRALEVQPYNMTSPKGVGMFAHRVRRLADFTPLMTEEVLLRDPSAQRDELCRSTVDYAEQIASGVLRVQPGMSLSGALGVLHRAGPPGLRRKKLLENARAVLERTNGIF